MKANSIVLANKDLIQSFGGYLDKPSLLTSVHVCKTWHAHLEKQRISILEDTYCEQMGYLRWLITDLRSCNLSLFRLPLLTVEQLKELENLESWTFFDKHLYEPYQIDPTSDPNEMLSYERRINRFPSLMRFLDEDGLPGIALKVRGTIEGRYKNKIPFRDLSILILFRPYGTPYPISKISNNTWKLHSREYIDAIYCYGHPMYINIHRNEPPHQQTGKWVFCPSCPSLSKNDKRSWFISLIKGEDSMVKLDGEIEQIQTAIPIPSPSPYLLQDPPQPLNNPPSLLLQLDSPVEPIGSTSLLHNCSRALCAFFSSIYDLFCYLISLCRREPAA